MLEVIKQTADHLKEKTNFEPQIGIILGTGLGGLVNEINIAHAISYEDIPNFPVSTVEGHKGQLIFGDLGGKRVVAMQGRFHFYEGYSMNELVFPVRVMKFLGIEKLMVSNASGGVNPDFEIGDIMLISDHINLFPTNPLMGPNMNELGPRFPDMSQAYSKDILKTAEEVAKELDIYVVKGIYAGLSGPTLETPAEYQYVRNVGADAVGMSTVPEVIAARHMGIPCFGVSVITDLGVPGKIVEVTHEDVQKVAAKAELILTKMVKRLFELI
ncbi:MAG: purine-nucleoside phosphorylase [Bacteroidota bacterium]|jgi:purine-nucleoside phosphorylase|nr:purine-nucleoside phosphorylase [Bacteroidota bacterium]|tara:strand:+ start:369 stop:1181 length:813 start_codon:yes stop_codon:yes gene_type:complete